MENKNGLDINRNNYIEYNNGTSPDSMLNDYYQAINESNELITHSNIAGMDQVVVSTSDKPIIGTQALDTCFGSYFTIEKINLEFVVMPTLKVFSV